MKHRVLTLALAASLVAPGIAQAQTSVACMYMLLRAYHAEVEYCRIPLPKVQADRYTRMKAGFENFIRANAKGDSTAMLGNVDNSVKRALAGLKSCKSDDFKLAQKALDQLLTAENEVSVTETLKYPQDPQIGGCG